MGESRNRVGGAYALTTFAPIIAGHEDELRAYIDGAADGRREPARAPRHAAPLAHPDLRPARRTRARSTTLDRLESSYLVFTSSFDGDLDPYLDLICERIAAEADGWWGHCVGYPGTADRAGVQGLDQGPPARTRNLFASRLPDGGTVAEVRESLALRDQLVDFAADAQGLDAAALQERFLSTFAKAGADAAPPPAGHRPALQAAGQPAPAPLRGRRHRPRRHPGQRPARLHLSRRPPTSSCTSTTSTGPAR